jgi:hypothetical protein
MYLFVIDGLLEKGKEDPLRGMPTEHTHSASSNTYWRNMGISGGASQVPAIPLPHDEDVRREFAYTNRFDFTAKGVVALVVISCAAIAGLFLTQSPYWYLGVAILAVDILVFFGPFFRITRPQVRRRNSND